MRCICITHMGPPILFARGIIFFQGILTKLHFLMKFPVLENFADLMKDLKYEHQSIFPFQGGSNLILGIGRKNQIFLLRTPAAVKFFSKK